MHTLCAWALCAQENYSNLGKVWWTNSYVVHKSQLFAPFSLHKSYFLTLHWIQNELWLWAWNRTFQATARIQIAPVWYSVQAILHDTVQVILPVSPCSVRMTATFCAITLDTFYFIPHEEVTCLNSGEYLNMQQRTSAKILLNAFWIANCHCKITLNTFQIALVKWEVTKKKAMFCFFSPNHSFTNSDTVVAFLYCLVQESLCTPAGGRSQVLFLSYYFFGTSNIIQLHKAIDYCNITRHHWWHGIAQKLWNIWLILVFLLPQYFIFPYILW